MFYCATCGEERNWPETISRSFGPCEICGKNSACYDRPARLLPLPLTLPDSDPFDDLLAPNNSA